MYPMINLGSPAKITPGVRALLHFFARFSDSTAEWDGFAVEMLKAESEAWTQAQGKAYERLIFADDFFPRYRGAILYSFGAYGDHHVLAFGSWEDALEDAAETLKPGYFTDVELPANYADLDEDAQDASHDEATTDLTYTESGYLASWEIRGSEVTPQDVISFIYEGEAAQ